MASTLKQLLVPKGKRSSSAGGSAQPGRDSRSDLSLKREEEPDADSLDTLAAQPQSPSPEAEYDKLLVSRKTMDLRGLRLPLAEHPCVTGVK